MIFPQTIQDISTKFCSGHSFISLPYYRELLPGHGPVQRPPLVPWLFPEGLSKLSSHFHSIFTALSVHFHIRPCITTATDTGPSFLTHLERFSSEWVIMRPTLHHHRCCCCCTENRLNFLRKMSLEKISVIISLSAYSMLQQTRPKIRRRY